MVYDSIKRCSNLENVDIELLRKAKNDGHGAFRHSKIHFDELKQWLIQNKNFYKNGTSEIGKESIATVKLANLKLDGTLKKLQIRSKEESLLSIEDVNNLLASIATVQVGLLNAISKETSIRCSGKSAGDIEFELNKEFKIFVEILKQDLKKLILE